MEQRTDEWFAARLGKVTASRVADVVATTKTGYSASREGYAIELALERITGRRQERYTNAAMQWGTETEPLARAAYEAATGNLVEECGLIDHPTIAMSGASPDGLIGPDGLLEIKCPEQKQHYEVLRTGIVPVKYMHQMYWQMACTKRAWCDFVSFDPRFPEHLQLFVRRIEADEKAIAVLETEVSEFLAEVAAEVKRVQSLKLAA